MLRRDRRRPFRSLPSDTKNPRQKLSGGDFLMLFRTDDARRLFSRALEARQAAAASLLLCRAFRMSRNTTRSAPLTSRQIQGLELTNPATR